MQSNFILRVLLNIKVIHGIVTGPHIMLHLMRLRLYLCYYILLRFPRTQLSKETANQSFILLFKYELL